MERRALIRACSPLLMLSLLAFLHTEAFAADGLQQIRQAITEKDAQWTASESWVTKLPTDLQKNLCSHITLPADRSRARVLSLPSSGDLPPKFDWRNNNGNWVTPPKNQNVPKSCGSCWAFAAIAQVESWWMIRNAFADSMIDLSEQCLLSCSNAGVCGWGDLLVEMNFLASVGVPTEECFSYQADDRVPCEAACSNWRENVVKIQGWGWITRDEPILENIKRAVSRHPVQAGYDVYEDFLSYSTGVYSHVWGNYLGGHQILIVGWNDEEQSWICKNSWGTEWGETVDFRPHTPGAGNGGYFRIKYGDCGIGSWVVHLWDEMAGSASFAYSPARIDTVLTVGDTLSRTLVLSNTGSGVLEFSCTDYQAGVKTWFLPSGFNAYSGQSWWCGDPAASGYRNCWLQYLDLPVLDLSHAATPKLRFMGYWAVEPLEYALPPFDGWDGCNIWVSVDGGKSFDVAHPTSPAYNCSSLYSFGSCGDGWGMGPAIAGWGGKSGGWKAVEFDLSPYKRDSVIIRFAFASDFAICALDDHTLYGFFVDDIVVADGSTVLLENHGVADSTMHGHGLAGWEKADWLTLSPGAGTIGPGGTLVSDLMVETAGLSAGRYCGIVNFASNDSAFVPMLSWSGQLRIDFELRSPVPAVEQHIAEVPAHWWLEQNYPNPFNPSTTIRYGLPQRATVSLAVFNTLGQCVGRLVEGEQAAGIYEVQFDGSGLGSGVYFYRMQAGRFTETRKLLQLH